MNEVEKMYENAKVEQKRMCEWTCKDSEVCNILCEHYESTQLYYPPFTAEKQLELIKWLARKDYRSCAESLLISIRDGYNYLSVGITTDFGSECFYEDFAFDNKQFDEAIAGLINKLWKKLTEEERKQIKEILE